MIAVLVKVTLVWALALTVVWSLRRGSAAMRHLVCAVALTASALMPLVLLMPQKLEVLRVPLVVVSATAARVSASSWRMGPVLVGLWGVGSLLVLLRIAVGLWRVRVVRRRAVRLGAEGAIPVLEANVAVPVAVGLFRPAILLPAGAAEWPGAYREAALRHEAAHIGRFDLWTNLGAHVVCAMYWFHPLVWAVARRLREEQELACDDVAVVSGTAPEVYAESLVAAARFLRPQVVTSLIGCHMVTNKSLQNRIARLVDVTLPRLSSTAALRRVALASAGVAVCVGLLTAQATKDPLFRGTSGNGAGEKGNTAAGESKPQATQASDKVYQMVAGMRAPRLIAKVDPEYTEEARAAKIDGAVLLSIVVGTDGLAHDINVVRGLDAGLDVRAVEAVQKWHFEPGIKDGEQVQVRAQIEINFKIK